MYRTLKTLTISIFCYSLLNGCAFLHPHHTNHHAAAPLHSALRLQNWQANGAISIHHGQGSLIGSFRWIEHPPKYHLSFAGPLGINAVDIDGNPHQTTLTSVETGKITDTDLQHLMQKELGWSLPLDQANFWMRGLPAPSNTYYANYDQYHHITDLWQSGWHIHLSHYQNIQGFSLPHKITLTLRKLTAKLAIKRWRIEVFGGLRCANPPYIS